MAGPFEGYGHGMKRMMAVILLCTSLSSGCSYAFPIIGESRATAATRATGKRHESRLIANIAGGIAVDGLLGLLLMVRAYGREQ